MNIFNSREEWLEARKSYIGGSECACIVGMNPYTTNVQLWEEKTGRREREDISDKEFVKYGSEAERPLRELFALDYPRYGVGYNEFNLWTNTLYPFAHYSADGVLYDHEQKRWGLLEIKTTNILQSMQKEKWNHRIPSNYYCQVLWGMAVMDVDFAILKASLRYDYDGEIFLNVKHYTIERREVEEDIAYLMEQGRLFSEYIRTDKRPPLVLPNL